jgi:predicted nucleotidyltransferase
MKSRYKKFINQIKDVIKQTDPTAEAILYGSRATGKARKDSDWDILILLDKSSVSLKDELPFRDNLYDLELETGEHISTFVYAKQEWNTRQSITPLYKSVQQNGILL